MTQFTKIILIGLLLPAATAITAFAGQTYMEITFDDKEIDQPIGMGGAGVGEPFYVFDNIEAIVRETPFETPSLEIHNTDPTANGGVQFLLSGGAVESGLAVIIMDLWFYGSGAGWTPYCEIYTPGYQVLLSFWTRNDGQIRIIGGGSETVVPSYPTGRAFPILIALDMDADTYSVWMDETQWVADEPLRHTDDSFSHIYWYTGSGCDPANRFSIDQIRVLDWVPTVAAESTTWGRVRSLFR